MPIWSAEIKEIESLSSSVKGRFPDLEKELERLLKADDENMILLYSRRCLEVIITELCESELKRPRKTEPLKGIIDKLHHEGKVPPHIISSMNGLNDLSTFGAHPKDFDPEQVKPVLNNLAIIIKWYLKFNEEKERSSKFQVSGSKSVRLISGERSDDRWQSRTDPDESRELKRDTEHGTSYKLRGRSKLNLVLLIIGILVVAAIILYPRIFKKNKLESLKSSDGRISVAVMPFQNMTNDSVWDVWQEGIQNNLITSLSNSPELKVRQTESITGLLNSKGLTNYASITPSVASKISQKLDANIFVSGSINQVGSKIRVNAQLIDSKTEEVFKSFQLNGTSDRILNILDSLAGEVKNFLIISKLKKGLSPDDYQLSATTSSPEAYSFFLLGNKSYRNGDFLGSYKIYLQALAIDSNFMEAALKLSVAYYNEYFFDEAKKWCLKAYAKRDQMPLQLKINTNRVYAILFEDHYEEIKYLRQLQELDDLLPSTYYSLGYAYFNLMQYEKAISELEKSLEIYDKLGLKPAWAFNYTVLGDSYRITGQYKKEEKLYKRAEKDFPDNLFITYDEFLHAEAVNDTVNANKFLEKSLRLARESGWTDPNSTAQIAQGYSEVGKLDKAEAYYRHALLLEPEKPERMNDLAFFLINFERSIDEGLELVNKALEIKPDNYLFLETKGWGLYRQGKYSEALPVVQKSWDLRREKAVYNHPAYLRLEEVKKAVANQESK
jgi:TolB-like protein/Tfp pilus assembly protein PilF